MDRRYSKDEIITGVDSLILDELYKISGQIIESDDEQQQRSLIAEARALKLMKGRLAAKLFEELEVKHG